MGIPQEEKIFLSVGQFIYRKGFDLLIKASGQIKGYVSIYIVGGQPKAEYLQNGMTRVHLVEFKRKNELWDYYNAADFFAFPTREDIWGLVINEALVHGLPVITSNKCVAGIELINTDQGIVLDNLTVDELIKAIDNFLKMSIEEYDKKSLAGVLRISEYTFEKMAIRHMEILNILEKIK